MEIKFTPKPHIEWEPDENFWADWDLEHEGIEEWGKGFPLNNLNENDYEIDSCKKTIR